MKLSSEFKLLGQLLLGLSIYFTIALNPDGHQAVYVSFIRPLFTWWSLGIILIVLWLISIIMFYPKWQYMIPIFLVFWISFHICVAYDADWTTGSREFSGSDGISAGMIHKGYMAYYDEYGEYPQWCPDIFCGKPYEGSLLQANPNNLPPFANITRMLPHKLTPIVKIHGLKDRVNFIFYLCVGSLATVVSMIFVIGWIPLLISAYDGGDGRLYGVGLIWMLIFLFLSGELHWLF